MTWAARGPMRVQVEVAGRRRLVTVEPIGTAGAGDRLALHWDDTTREVDASALGPGRLSMILSAPGRASRAVRGDQSAPGDWVLGIDGRQVPGPRVGRATTPAAPPRRRRAATTRWRRRCRAAWCGCSSSPGTGSRRERGSRWSRR